MNIWQIARILILAAFSVTLAGCVITPMNGVGGQVGFRNQNGFGSISFGGAPATQQQQQVVVIAQQQQQTQRCNGPILTFNDGHRECRPCQAGMWNGQTCLVQVQQQGWQQNQLSNQSCPSGYRMNSVGSWMCRD